MVHATRWHRTIAIAMVAMLGTAACSKADDTAEREVGGTAGGTVTQPALSVADVKLGKNVDANMRVTEETDDFARADRIYASVETQGTATSATLTARWTFEDGQVVDESTQTIAPTGPAVTEFHISQAGGLPAGKYKVTILLNGAEVESEEFEVK